MPLVEFAELAAVHTDEQICLDVVHEVSQFAHKLELVVHIIDEVAHLADELELAVDRAVDDNGKDADDELEHMNLLIRVVVNIGSTKRFQYAEKTGVGVFLYI
jgi:hypothetical protein